LQIQLSRYIISTKMALIFDKIGYWSEIKLEIIEKYASAYSIIFSSPKYNYFRHVYIDAFSGSGTHFSKTTKSQVRGSPQRALDIDPPFKEYYFVDTNGRKLIELRKIAARYNSKNINIIEADCNTALLTQVFPKLQDKYDRGLCLLDPYGLDLHWEVIETAGKLGKIEIFLNFPVMDMRRNAFLGNPEEVTPINLKRMDLFWGNHSWRNISYFQATDIFGDVIELKQKNIKIVTEAFRERLLNIADFQFVPQPIPMRNSRGALLYYLFFASNNKTGNKIVTEIFTKYRNWGMK
jgi:three-Cys-motif partner protein